MLGDDIRVLFLPVMNHQSCVYFDLLVSLPPSDSQMDCILHDMTQPPEFQLPAVIK